MLDCFAGRGKKKGTWIKSVAHGPKAPGRNGLLQFFPSTKPFSKYTMLKMAQFNVCDCVKVWFNIMFKMAQYNAPPKLPSLLCLINFS